MRSLDVFYTVAFEYSIARPLITFDKAGVIDFGTWIDGMVPECYRENVRRIVTEEFERFRNEMGTEHRIEMLVRNVLARVFNEMEPVHP